MHMRKLLFFTSAFLIVFNTCTQTLIATSRDHGATQNHNQRKIVRDHSGNIYVAYSDWMSPDYVVKGVMYDNVTGEWGDEFVITEGYNPTLAIEDSNSCEIHLICESFDSGRKIKHLRSSDFLSWNSGHIISDTAQMARMPVADIDSAGILNIFWIQGITDSTESLIYASVAGDSLLSREVICSKNEINDIALANHLRYEENDLFFGVEFDQDSVIFFRSTDGMNNYDTIYSAIGHQPAITYNSNMEDWPGSRVRLLYIDDDSYIMEVEIDFEYNHTEINRIPVGKVDYYCVDDLAPPIGYSFLFMQWGYLYHGFSYGVVWDWCSIMETITGDEIVWPSVAYKHFNFEFVDFIWMEGYGVDKEIYYLRDEKHVWTDIYEDNEKGKDFSIIGFPNPFSEAITFNVTSESSHVLPAIEILDSQSVLIKRLKVNKDSEQQYTANWDGTNESLEKVCGGLYIVLCSVGDKRTARKILFNP